jgi:hypothetical protein
MAKSYLKNDAMAGTAYAMGFILGCARQRKLDRGMSSPSMQRFKGQSLNGKPVGLAFLTEADADTAPVLKARETILESANFRDGANAGRKFARALTFAGTMREDGTLDEVIHPSMDGSTISAAVAMSMLVDGDLSAGYISQALSALGNPSELLTDLSEFTLPGASGAGDDWGAEDVMEALGF